MTEQIISLDKTYRTRCGSEVVIYAIYPGQKFPVHGAYKYENGDWRTFEWRENGQEPGSIALNLVEVEIAK
jgi:hypothetical protein